MPTVTVSAATDWSTSASAAIAAAIMSAGVGGFVYFPAGVYRITEPIVPLAGQTLYGDSYVSTVLRIDFSAVGNFLNMALIRKSEVGGVVINPGVSVRGLTIDGGRSQCGRPNYETGPDCPYGAAGGVALGVSWTVSRCRITNVNGAKTGCFGAHDARLEYNVWDNDGGGTGGDQDNIGGGGVTHLEIIGNVFAENCAGSGIDITTGGDLVIEGNRLGYRSLILEGIQGAVVRGNTVYRSMVDSDAGSINVKSNTAYASAEEAGAWCSRDVLIERNTVINSWSPGIIVSSTWDDKGPGDVTDGGRYGKARGIEVRDNLVVNPLGLGIYLGGQDRARANAHAVVDGNEVISPRAGTSGNGSEWSSGLGYLGCGGVGLGSGDGVKVTNNRTVRYSGSSAAVALVNGARLGSSTVRNTVDAGNSVVLV